MQLQRLKGELFICSKGKLEGKGKQTGNQNKEKAWANKKKLKAQTGKTELKMKADRANPGN
jgi:hypothetical protein